MFGLTLLVGHEWLSLEVIEKFITKINAIVNESKLLLFLALKELGGHLIERYTYWILERERYTKRVCHCKCWEKQVTIGRVS